MRTKRPPKAKGKKLNAGQRSLKFLRGQGFTAEVCEKYITNVFGAAQKERFAGGYRKDLFGFMDILAYRDDGFTLAVQTTSRQQMTKHLRDYRRDPELCERIRNWIRGEGRGFVVHGWEPLLVPTKAGGTKVRWEVTVRAVTMLDVVAIAAIGSE